MTISGSNVTIDGAITCYGDLTAVSSATLGITTNSYFFIFEGSGTITLNGATCRYWVWIGLASSATYSLGSAFTSTGRFDLEYGSLTTNNYSLTVGQFDARGSAGTKTLNLGTSTLTMTTAGTSCMLNSTSTFNFTWSTGAQMTFTNTGTVSVGLNGGGKLLPPVNFNNNGPVEVQNSNTFTDIRSTYVGAKTFNFTPGETNTFIAFNLRGTSGNLYTIKATFTTAQATLRKSGAWYMGANSTNSGNNTGLTFSGGSGIDYLDVSYINGVSVGGQGNLFALLN
jgi:hypothetical protein